MLIVCKNCGKEFKTYRKNSIFCCKTCQNIFRKNHSITFSKICPVCHKDFICKHERIICCSRSCASKLINTGKIHSKKTKLKQSIKAKKYWSNLENRKKQSIIIKQARSKPETIIKIKNGNLKRWKNPKIKKELVNKIRKSIKNITKEQRIIAKQKEYNTRKKNGTLFSSKVEKDWLKSLNIPNLLTQYRLNQFIIDGYNPNTKTCYEFLGDYYHQNPRNTKTGKIYTENSPKFQNTLFKFQELKKLGYNIIYCWEFDWKNNNLEFFERCFIDRLEY